MHTKLLAALLAYIVLKDIRRYLKKKADKPAGEIYAGDAPGVSSMLSDFAKKGIAQGHETYGKINRYWATPEAVYVEEYEDDDWECSGQYL